MSTKYRPEIETLLQPIVNTMSQIHWAQKHDRRLTPQHDSEMVKEAKKMCVHMVYENNQYNADIIHEQPDGSYVCDACGARIYANLKDDSAVKILKSALEVINMMTFIGPQKHMNAETLNCLLSLKSLFPSLIEACDQLLKYMKLEESNNNAEANLGDEYVGSGLYRSITG